MSEKDREDVLKAVSQDLRALQHASEELQGDRWIMLAAGVNPSVMKGLGLFATVGAVGALAMAVAYNSKDTEYSQSPII